VLKKCAIIHGVQEKQMKLVSFRKDNDWGKDYYLTILQIKRWCLIQSCFTFAVYGGRFPYFNITMGGGRLIAISFDVLKYGFCVEIISRSWFK
jgi:hypothetical protein